MERYTIVLQFFLGENQDDATDCSYQFYNTMGLPRVGDKVSVWETRDKDGNYSRKSPEKDMEGIVTKIEHLYEQNGHDHLDWHMTHFISVFLKPIKG